MANDNANTNPSAAATQYVLMCFFFEFLSHLFATVSLSDMFRFYSLLHMIPYLCRTVLHMLFSGSYVHMSFVFSSLYSLPSFVVVMLVMFFLVFPVIKSYGKLLIYPTQRTSNRKRHE